MARNLEELTKEYLKQSAILECKNLMGYFVYYSSSWENKKLLELWADATDCLLQMPWGVYDGKESVSRCFLKDYGDRYDDGKLEWLRGIMYVHSINTPLIQVATNGQTAKAVWIMTGHDTFPDAPGEKANGYWSWGKYDVDFIFENGKWKIWHLRFYPFFRTPYNTPWTDAKAYTKAFFETSEDRPLEEPNWSYDVNSIYPINEPSLPEPYDHY